MKMIKSTVAVLSIFTPFLLVAFALIIVPHPLQALKSAPGIDWIWLILLGAMLLGMFYWLFYIEEEEEITEEFMELDSNHDGYISREEASKWNYLAREFDKFDTNHDGRLSRQEYEKAVHQ